jgi:hypothetical protein
MRSPRQIFEDNIRPADLLLRVYRLLNTDDRLIERGELVDALRSIINASENEGLMVINNEIFLGLVREAAEIPTSTLRRSSLSHFLRQGVVASCTALETYLPAMMKSNLPVVIRAMGRDFRHFIPEDDKAFKEKFKTLTFSLEETLRILADPIAPEMIANKIIGYIDFSYLSGSKGVHIVGKLLGLPRPIPQIAERLNRGPEELERILNDTIQRRNDIVHRADYNKESAQEITYAWALHAIDSIRHICITLDELVGERMLEFESAVATTNE